MASPVETKVAKSSRRDKITYPHVGLISSLSLPVTPYKVSIVDVQHTDAGWTSRVFDLRYLQITPYPGR